VPTSREIVDVHLEEHDGDERVTIREIKPRPGGEAE
jgi:hypothetical protein